MARDERFPDEVGVDRRTFMKAAIGLGAAGLTGASLVLVLGAAFFYASLNAARPF